MAVIVAIVPGELMGCSCSRTVGWLGRAFVVHIQSSQGHQRISKYFETLCRRLIYSVLACLSLPLDPISRSSSSERARAKPRQAS
jgi:hypothetical protein